MTAPTALALRALGLGDFFTGLPALAMLRAALPDHRIVLAAPVHFEPLAVASGSVDAVAPAHELEPICDAPHRPDLAIDLHGNAMPSVELLRASDPVRVVSYATGQARWDQHEHEVQRWCRLVHAGVGGAGPFPSVTGVLRWVPAADVPDGVTVVHCGAKAGARRWPPDRFAAVAEQLRRRGHRVLVVGSADQAATVAAIARTAGVTGTSDLSLFELIALVARARLLISGDTGVAHVASNYAVASVVLFGPVPPSEWGPPPHRRHQVLWHGSGRGDPLSDTLDPALDAITVDEALARVEVADSAPLGVA